MAKVSLPVNQGIPFSNRTELDTFLMDRGLHRTHFRRVPGLMERWRVTAQDGGGWRYSFTAIADETHLWLLDWTREWGLPAS